ncbi:CheF family chemotaxis protein [Archaeoglobus veneficus]|uniref:Taxis protein n=1 Tax=Archaeoglobus veneficus (strain DSM 11195 / SNP6) TaxID=693661 RepID=F2KNE6_ARCVS|nr:CheF family chemotaxis protein [Archaeoglobus veneficus]AEA47348.1 protein of unknown function DUF439 [Archaeoglobus veneficus SNP6]
MEKIVADFMAKSAVSLEKGVKRKIEDFEKSRIILSTKRLLIASASDRIVIPLSSIFDVRKIEVPDDLKDMLEDSMKIAFVKNGSPNIVVIKAKDDRLSKFFYLLMKLLLMGNPVIYKHPAIRGGIVLNTIWKNGKLGIARGAILLDQSKIKLSSVRDIKKELRTVNSKKVEILNVRLMENGEAVVSYIYIPDKRVLNLLSRYVGFEFADILKKVEKANLSKMEKQVLQAIYSGVTVEDLPAIMGMEAADVHRIVYSLEQKGMLKNGRLTVYGEVAVSRYVEDINV